MTTPRQIKIVEDLAQKMEPVIRDAFLDVVQRVVTDIDMDALIASLGAGDVNSALALVAVDAGSAFALTEAIRSAYVQGGSLTGDGLPSAMVGRFSFNGRHERAEAWIGRNAGELIQGISEETLQTSRAVILEGFEKNRTPDQIARDLTGRVVSGVREGGMIGLNSEQSNSVLRAREILSDPERIREYFVKDRITGRWKPRFKLTDRRFDSTVIKAIKSGTPLTETQIRGITEAHKSKALGYRGRVIAKDQSFTAIAAGRAEGFQQISERPDVEDVTKRWQHNLSENPRDDHQAMDGTVVSLNEAFQFSDASMQNPHDPSGGAGHSIGCRCICFYRVVVSKG